MQFRIVVVIAATLSLASSVSGQTPDWSDADAVARAALDRHPAFSSVEARKKAARERLRIAGSYPNPMLMAGVQNHPLDLSQDEMMTMYMIGASQSIPRRSRRDVLKRSAELTVEGLQFEERSLAEEIVRAALFSWHDLAAADSKITATEHVAAAVDAVVAAARFRYEVGTTIQADVIRAQLQRSNIDHQLLTLSAQRRVAATRLLAQLGLPLTTLIPRIHMPHASEGRKIHHAPMIPDDHPQLAAIATEVKQREQDIRLATLMSKPDWNIEATYGMRAEQTDMFSVVARVELPLRKKAVIEPQIRAATADRDAVAQRLEETRRRLLEDMGVAYGEHAEATTQLRLHEDVLVPQSELAFQSSLAAYQGGKDVFESVLASEAAWLALEIDYFDLLRHHIQAIIDFEAIQRGARGGLLGRNSGSPDTPMNASSGSTPSAGSGSMR